MTLHEVIYNNLIVIQHSYFIYFKSFEENDSNSLDAGSDGNFDSYLMGMPKAGDYDILTAVMLTIVLTIAAMGTSIYIYIYLVNYLNYN